MSQTPTPGPSTPEPIDPIDPAGSADPVAPGEVRKPTPDPEPPTATGPSGKPVDPLRSSRTSGFYSAVVGLGVVLVLLIIFIVQNTDKAPVRFLSFEGNAPQAVLLLIALAAGIFLTATASTLRLLQVRRRVKKERKLR